MWNSNGYLIDCIYLPRSFQKTPKSLYYLPKMIFFLETMGIFLTKIRIINKVSSSFLVLKPQSFLHFKLTSKFQKGLRSPSLSLDVQLQLKSTKIKNSTSLLTAKIVFMTYQFQVDDLLSKLFLLGLVQLPHMQRAACKTSTN